MNTVKLTNIGNLTLQNLLNLEKKYKENANLKKNKLAKLWDSKDDMDAFVGLFSFYHDAKPDSFITKVGKKYFLRDKFIPTSDSELSSNLNTLLDKFNDMGLVALSPTKNLEDTFYYMSMDIIDNPASNINSVIIELTGACNLKCNHCYRGGSNNDEYGLPSETIKKALKPLLRAGIESIMLTGGEPTIRMEVLVDTIEFLGQHLELRGVSGEERLEYKYGISNPTVDDVLKTDRYVKIRKQLMDQLTISKEELIPGNYYIYDKHTPEDVEEFLETLAQRTLKHERKADYFDIDRVSLLTNGFFDNQREFVKFLKVYNVQLQTSLDSFNGHTTNKNRGKKGVFGKVKELASICKEEGLMLSITGHDIGGVNTLREKENQSYFNKTSHIFVANGMMQLGNATGNGFEPGNTRKGNNFIGSLSPSNSSREGWCTGWTSPSDIHIKPTGVVGNCLYAHAIPEEFGNIKKTPMADIINGIQDSRVYGMFMDGRIEKYQHELDKSLFPKEFRTPCEPMVLTLTYGVIKERLIEQGVKNPIEKANQQVAKLYKFNINLNNNQKEIQ